MQKVHMGSQDVPCYPIQVATVTEGNQTGLFAKFVIYTLLSIEVDIQIRPVQRYPDHL